MSVKAPPSFTSFLVKVASRCNLNCSYCYMYQHADQSWKKKPLTLSAQHQDLLATRLLSSLIIELLILEIIDLGFSFFF